MIVYFYDLGWQYLVKLSFSFFAQIITSFSQCIKIDTPTILNSLNTKGAGFKSDTNKVTFVFPNNKITEFKLKSKLNVARDIANTVKDLIND